MQVTLLGMGCFERQLTAEAAEEIAAAGLLIGAKRMLESLPPHSAEHFVSYEAEEIVSLLKNFSADRACVVYSGDSGFYSGARLLIPLLEKAGIAYRVLPGISSLQTLSSRIGRPWQNWKLCSAHGTACDPLKEIMCGRPCFFLTGGTSSPSGICAKLTAAGLGKLGVYAASCLGMPDECVMEGTAEEIAKMEFPSLSVLLTDPAPVYPEYPAGIPDEEFLREKVPMTKREVRAVILSSLRIRPEDICWDIGAGTGSVSVELALHSAGVWAMERSPEAVELIQKNREKFCAWNLRTAEGSAPDGLEAFPVPTAVFIGGSGGRLREIVQAVYKKNPQARICISAIALETLSAACEILKEFGCSVSVTQIAVSRTKQVGAYSMLTAQNPVFLIVGERQ